MFGLVDTESMDLMTTMEVDHVLHLITGFSFICGKINLSNYSSRI